jgi:Flp pilus assembly pilin Flp
LLRRPDMRGGIMSLKERLNEFFAKATALIRSDKGQTLIEYGLLVVLIAVIVILMLKGTGEQVNSLYSTINSGLSQ